jgi:DNA invertase Pin-like site-specific DNA recombinase
MNRSTSPLRAALYARVATDRQSTENQLRELRQVAGTACHTIGMVKRYYAI